MLMNVRPWSLVSNDIFYLSPVFNVTLLLSWRFVKLGNGELSMVSTKELPVLEKLGTTYHRWVPSARIFISYSLHPGFNPDYTGGTVSTSRALASS